MVRKRMAIFGARRGFVFNPVHNVQPGIPIENLLVVLVIVKS